MGVVSHVFPVVPPLDLHGRMQYYIRYMSVCRIRDTGYGIQ